MNYKQRMLQELIDLTEKIVKLEKYNETDTTGDIETRQFQLEYMRGYGNALAERLMKILADTEVKND